MRKALHSREEESASQVKTLRKGSESMLTQTNSTTVADLDIRSIPSPPVFIHLITLINRCTRHEVSLTIETLSDRFADVMREITHQKVMNNLQGYEVFEVLDLNNPF